ncbi:MAG: hypothetical protein H0W75_08125 [Chitinophagaceae bacterium]|nr:hypothetical protein [Chitinophagaceae bacterium]
MIKSPTIFQYITKINQIKLQAKAWSHVGVTIEGKAWYRLVGCLAVVGCYIAISIDRKNYCLYTSSL